MIDNYLLPERKRSAKVMGSPGRGTHVFGYNPMYPPMFVRILDNHGGEHNILLDNIVPTDTVQSFYPTFEKEV